MPAPPPLRPYQSPPLTRKWTHAVRASANAAARDPEARRRPHPSPLWSHVASLTTKWAHAGWDPANADARDPAAWRARIPLLSDCMSPPFLQSGCTQGGHSANRLQGLCFRNGNIYIKLGQHITQLLLVCLYYHRCMCRQ